MELFYTNQIASGRCLLDQEESGHCIKVLRHRKGDTVHIIDGEGTLYECVLTDDSPKSAVADIVSSTSNWGCHYYHLTMAVCPTKNIDRFEWFAEKATEMGFDCLAPVIGDHSERKVLKTDRIRKILLSATKQSLKASIPDLLEPVKVSDFILSHKDSSALKLIAYCFEDESHLRRSIKEEISSYLLSLSEGELSSFVILIGPEGDFSKSEAKLAMECGFKPVHLGPSRLRTETAAISAVAAVYIGLEL